ncbi:Neuropeptide Y receptor [Orchesella cincta]|uniref:Neuropeptide Y receptor n=1 Tax=Orchesella cincta TaxID=48709 RepID=A0A1D2MSL6_ORCCI|nr:Neuropeptide Y receptor [Orchesella cincta]
MDPKLGTKPFCTNLGLSPTFRMYYTLGLVVIQYFFPLIIISAAYTHMATKLWGTTAPGNKEESRDAVVLRNKKK